MTEAAPSPKLELTVPRPLWDTIASIAGRAYTDSYLSGAEVLNTILRAKTNVAFDRLAANSEVMLALRDAGLKLLSPNGRAVDGPFVRKRIRAEELPAIRVQLAELYEAMAEWAAKSRKLFRPVPATYVRTDGRGLSAEMRALMAQRKPAQEEAR